MPKHLAGCDVSRRTASASDIAPQLARPVAEQMQAEPGVVEERQVRAGIAQD